MKIKVCGMREKENIQDLMSLDINYMGLIFYEKSKRNISVPKDFELKKGVKAVGVFVNENITTIAEKIKQYNLAAIQLHGKETPEFCSKVKELGIEVFKAFSIDESFSFDLCHQYEESCSLFIFDTKGKQYGGNGVKFDWSLLDQYKGKTNFLLSGGIALEDAPLVKDFVHPKCVGVDINSGFEIDFAHKNITKIKEFMSQVKENYFVDEFGFYGKYGGAFVPEMLKPNLDELNKSYINIIESEEFKEEYKSLLKDYVGRPSPLYYATRLSQQYQTNIYLKREDLNHTGAHKINNTVGQILLAKRLGKTRIIAETGAGQHGVATATVCALMNMQCIVYMGEVDIQRQAPNVARMRMLGAEVRAAQTGSKTLKDATNEAIRDWINNPVDTFYIIGSVVGPHPYPDMVARLQSIISKEVKEQLFDKVGKQNPDYVIACVGGGSNAMGSFYNFLNDGQTQLIAAEAAGKGVDSGKTAASIAKGKEGVIHGSKTMLMQTKDGQIVEPYSISAGLDYPGIGPALSHYAHKKRVQIVAVTDQEALDAALNLTRKEGIIPALESAHAIAVLDKKKFQEEDLVVITVSGRGDKDMATYMNRLSL